MTSVADEIPCDPQPVCPICGSGGPIVYANRPDRLFGAPGLWSYRRCSSQECSCLWMDPLPKKEFLYLAYRDYYTHSSDHHVPRASREPMRWALENLKWLAARAYMARRWGYSTLGPRERVWEKALSALTAAAPSFRGTWDLVVRYQSAGQRGRLLDIGCGAGDAIMQLGRLGWQAEGADIDDKALAFARSRGLTVHTLDNLEQPGLESRFDVVSASHVIEHVTSIPAFLAQCKRLLKVGGRLVINTPNSRGSLLDSAGIAALALDTPRHLVLLSQEALRRLIKEAGFDVVKCFSSVRDYEGYRFASEQIRLKGRHVWGEKETSLLARSRSYASELSTQIDLLRGHREGDELVLIAVK